MEELRRLAKKYYNDTIKLSYFGLYGMLIIVISLPFLALSLLLNFKYNIGNASTLPLVVAVALWFFAKYQYDKNLNLYLSKFTHLDSKDLNVQKAHYLDSITGHISPSLFETLKIFKEIQDTENKNRSFVLNNVGFYFSKFLYDPDAKNRILSLTIYLISLIAIVTVVKPPNEYNIYELIDTLSFNGVMVYFSICFVIIVFSYFAIIVPIMFFTTFVVTPLMLKFSNVYYLNQYFISELNRYSLWKITS